MRTVTSEPRVSAILETSSLVSPRILEQYDALEWKLSRSPESGVALDPPYYIYRQGRRRKEYPELTVLYTFTADEVSILSYFTTAGKRSDARRTWHLEQKGYYVLRFQNKEIMELAEVTLDTIAAIHRARLNHDVCP